ncbi:AraC family transcriptional regulator [Lachnospiraceae bacterium 54-53]
MHSIGHDFGLKVIYEDNFQTIYTLDKEHSGTRMIIYRLYPGIEVTLYDFKDRYTWAGQWKTESEVYQISYSHRGVYQAELSKNRFSYSLPGNVIVLNNCKQSLGSRMITDALQGFSILIFPELLDAVFTEHWKNQFDLQIPSLRDFFRKIKMADVFPCGAGMLHVAEELYESLYNNETGMVRLKILEFFYLIIKEDFKIENIHRVFSREQIEKTRTIKELIEMDLARHYTIKELCENYGISTTIFKECFKQMFQYPPYEFLRIARMNQAADYLKGSQRSILEIGRLLGYENPSNFTRTFKEIYGVLPKEFRKENV